MITGTIHPSSGPIFNPPGYYLVVYLDPQVPWPEEFKNGGKVKVEILPK